MINKTKTQNKEENKMKKTILKPMDAQDYFAAQVEWADINENKDKEKAKLQSIEEDLYNAGLMAFLQDDDQLNNINGYVAVYSGFKKLLNFVAKKVKNWEVYNLNGVSYFANMTFCTPDRFPNQNHNHGHMMIKSLEAIEIGYGTDGDLTLTMIAGPEYNYDELTIEINEINRFTGLK